MNNAMPSPHSPSHRRLPRWLALILGGVCVTAIGVVFFGHSGHAPAPQAPLPPGAFRATEAQWAGFGFAVAEQKTFQDAVRAEGKIASNEDTTTPVFSPYSGRVTKLYVKAGDYVKRGAPLMAIAASEFVQGQNDLVAARQTLDNSESQLKLATASEKRQHALFDAKSAALKDWEQAQADLQTAKANFHTAENSLAAVRNRLRILGKSDEEIAKLEAAQKINAVSAEAVVTAPISGTVTQRQVGLGEYINSAAGGASVPVFAIGDLSTVWVLANVRETDAPLMHVGAPVEVRVLAYPDKIFKAKLTYVAPTVDPVLHRLSVRAEVKNQDDRLKPEMFASFSISAGDDVSTVSVPEEAVIYEGDTARVWVADKDKLVTLRQIQAGTTADREVEVLDGLKPGETVVTSGSLFIDRAAKSDAPSPSQ